MWKRNKLTYFGHFKRGVKKKHAKEEEAFYLWPSFQNEKQMNEFKQQDQVNPL